MASGFGKGVWTLLLTEAMAAAAAIAFSPKVREAARPYLVAGFRRAMALGDEMKDMINEARLEAGHIVSTVETEAEHHVTGQH